jgi:hypothetical protein
MHPGDAISLGDAEQDAAGAALVQAARATVDAINALNWWSPTNGLCMAWPPASRVSDNASKTLDAFTAALEVTLQPNMWPWLQNRPNAGWGCPIENAGATLAVADLLMQSHEGFIRLFPAGWADDSPASFESLRADGGFLVSAATAAGGVPDGAVAVTSLVGGNCTLAQPRGWPATVVVTRQPQGDEIQSVRHSRGSLLLFTFPTEAASSYAVKPGL